MKPRSWENPHKEEALPGYYPGLPASAGVVALPYPTRNRGFNPILVNRGHLVGIHRPGSRSFFAVTFSLRCLEADSYAANFAIAP